MTDRNAASSTCVRLGRLKLLYRAAKIDPRLCVATPSCLLLTFMPAAVQGNGTAAIFQGDSRVTTFDMHGAEAPGLSLIDASDACCVLPECNLASSGHTERKI